MPKLIPDEQLFDAALTVMVREGYRGATTQQIAREAQVSEVTLFRRFETKAGLLAALLRHELARFSDTGALEHTGDLEEDLVRVVEVYGQAIARHSRLMPMITSNAAEHPELAEVAQVAFGLVRAVAELMAAYQEAGELVDEPPLTAVAALFGPLLLTAMVQSVPVHPEVPDAREHVRRFIKGRANR